MKEKEMIEYLEGTQRYRIIERYEQPLIYNFDPSVEKLRGTFLDVETTGLNYETDKIIELGLVTFEYSKDGTVFRIIDEFIQYQDPGELIPAMIPELTGITDEMVKDHHITLDRVEKYLENSNLIISHNAQFDRTFFESLCPALSKKPWVCLMKNIDWKAEGIESHKLEYLAYRFGFFYEGHRAIIDCLAGIHILSKRLPKSNRLVLTGLLENCRKIIYKLWAKDAPYEYKDLLKKREYRWERNTKKNYQAWTIELNKENLENEINYLRKTIYGRKILLPIDILDAYTRFSVVNTHSCSKHHKSEIEWLATL